MKITKYGHACLLIEDKGKRLLIDPGAFTFNGHFMPEQIGVVDVIIVTHAHPDHMVPEVIKNSLSSDSTVVVGSGEVVRELQNSGIEAKSIAPNASENVLGFSVQAFNAPHGPMPTQAENFAYLINGRLLHPGDSYSVSDLPAVEILALPTQGPWSRMVDAIEYAKIVKPRIVIPMHNAMLKDELTPIYDGMIVKAVKDDGIGGRVLAIGESVEL
jgi:L-ascorbate metabolism protein UlaG (beta-lactamase superfamily)